MDGREIASGGGSAVTRAEQVLVHGSLTYPAEAGNVILFESWLRHEVPSNRVPEERISVSFNYAWS